jgi:hypothetical protein
LIIESHKEHGEFLRLLEVLMQSGGSRDDEDEGLMQILSKAIEAYELIHFPIPDPTAEEAAAFRRAEGGPICAKKGHVPVQKMSATICDRCRVVLDGNERQVTMSEYALVEHNPDTGTRRAVEYKLLTAEEVVTANQLMVKTLRRWYPAKDYPR